MIKLSILQKLIADYISTEINRSATELNELQNVGGGIGATKYMYLRSSMFRVVITQQSDESQFTLKDDTVVPSTMEGGGHSKSRGKVGGWVKLGIVYL